MQIMETLKCRLHINSKMIEFVHHLPNFEMTNNEKSQPPLNLHA